MVKNNHPTKLHFLFLTFLFFQVTAHGQEAIKLTVSAQTANVSASVAVSWSGLDGSTDPSDWIGLYPAGGADGLFHPSLAWQQVNGNQSGTVNFSLPQNPGNYEFRYFSQGSYSVLGRTGSVQVSRPALAQCLPANTTRSKIKHVVVIVQENHSFDSYFGAYCKAPTGSEPECHNGPGCCEMAPLRDPTTGVGQTDLNDISNVFYGPNHTQACELAEMNGGKMDRYIAGTSCSDPRNFAVAQEGTLGPYFQYARQYALADRYFQPLAGASSSNDMYLAQAKYAFTDNAYVPNSKGTGCYSSDVKVNYQNSTIGDLLAGCSVPWAFYAEGYNLVLADPFPNSLLCTEIVYDPTDNPFQYYANFRDNLDYMQDTEDFTDALSDGDLPPVSFVKALEINTEHPGAPIAFGVGFTTNLIDQILQSPLYKDNTLILLTADESGGYYDHISPPSISPVDGQPYGPRTFLLAIGPFAKTNYVSHVTMEHSSILRFIEWNFLGGEPGQLGNRDANVNNLGDLIDPIAAGIQVP